MTRIVRVLVALALVAAPVAADPSRHAAPARPATCKRVAPARGVDRKPTCEIEASIVVKGEPPRPGVIVVPRDGKTVVGRPRSGDRLAGLSHQLR